MWKSCDVDQTSGARAGNISGQLPKTVTAAKSESSEERKGHHEASELVEIINNRI